LEENADKRVFLLSQMIHNQEVNEDLQQRGIKFIMDTDGTQFIPWEEIKGDDIVIIPAFGTTREIEHLLLDKGVEVQQYNTTCPFVEKVWNRAGKMAKEQFTTIIHGKPNHEETRATFSHSASEGPAIIVRDMEDALKLGAYITETVDPKNFHEQFAWKFSEGFDPKKHLIKVGVVNQTTMLATETQAIADYFKKLMISKFGIENLQDHFADTKDTLCYATNDNQDATYELLETDADLAIVVGGYNSSNTSHIVELCERKFPTYFINSEKEMVDQNLIRHFNFHKKEMVTTENFLPNKNPVKIILTSGASCPDTVVDRVMEKIVSFFPNGSTIENVLKEVFD
jgi:4-hydroxy-3-methylbut-2-enyl diphosphate reductase